MHDIAIYDHPEGESVSLHLKMDPEVPLIDAHEVAERVEEKLRAEPEVVEVHSHLEPLADPGFPRKTLPRQTRRNAYASSG